MRRITASALVAIAGFAVSAGAVEPGKAAKVDNETAKAHRGEAKRHVWTSEVALEQAKLGVQGLYALATDEEGAWDKEHATALLENVKGDLRLAATHLAHLTNLPCGKGRDAMTDLTRAQTGIAKMQTAIMNLEGPIRGGMTGATSDTKPESSVDRGVAANHGGDHGMRTQIKEAWKTLDEAMGDFRKVATDYKVTTRLPVP